MITLFSHGKDDTPEPDDELVTSASGTAQLSVAAVENDFVAGVYEKLASVYDLAFGPALQPGRIRAVERMNIQPGERVLEVGVGTGQASISRRRCWRKRESARRGVGFVSCGSCRWMRPT